MVDLIDSNIVLRWIAKDDSQLLERVVEFIGSEIDNGNNIFVHPVALCEVFWVLTSNRGPYQWTREQVLNAFEDLANTSGFIVTKRPNDFIKLIGRMRSHPDVHIPEALMHMYAASENQVFCTMDRNATKLDQDSIRFI